MLPAWYTTSILISRVANSISYCKQKKTQLQLLVKYSHFRTVLQDGLQKQVLSRLISHASVNCYCHKRMLELILCRLCQLENQDHSELGLSFWTPVIHFSRSLGFHIILANEIFCAVLDWARNSSFYKMTFWRSDSISFRASKYLHALIAEAHE